MIPHLSRSHGQSEELKINKTVIIIDNKEIATRKNKIKENVYTKAPSPQIVLLLMKSKLLRFRYRKLPIRINNITTAMVPE